MNHDVGRAGTREKARLKRVTFDVTAQCNLRCYACNHFSPFAEGFASVASFEQSAAIFSRYAHARDFHILGGEPLLHPDLLQFVRAAKRLGVGERVRVVTNGLLLKKQPEEFWREMDSLKLSLYAATADKLDLPWIRRQCSRYDVELILIRRPRFFEAAADFRNTDDDLVCRMFRACLMADICHALKDGRLYRCTPAAYMGPYLRRVGCDASFLVNDGLLLEDRPDMAERIRRYFTSREPLEACRFCLSCFGPEVEHRQMTAQEVAHPRRWKRAEELVDRRRMALCRLRMRLHAWFGRLPGPLRRPLRSLNRKVFSGSATRELVK